MPIWHQSPKLTPRYFLETPRLFGYPTNFVTTPHFLFKPLFCEHTVNFAIYSNTDSQHSLFFIRQFISGLWNNIIPCCQHI